MIAIDFPASGVPATEFCLQFVQGMADRMGLSFFKYGAVADAYPQRVNAIDSLKKRLEQYEQTGNTEWLMDVANFAMIEFMHPRHPDAHFRPTDSPESPGRVWNSGEARQDANTFETERLRTGGTKQGTTGGCYRQEGD